MVEERNDKKGQKTVPRDGAIVGPTPRGGVSRPVVGSSTFQLAGIVLDTSGSMAGSPIAEVIAATTACVMELADPKNRDAFHVSVVVYGDTAKEHLAPKVAGQVRPDELVVQVGMVGGSTNITAGLSTMLPIVEEVRPGNWARPIVILMTDGHNTETPPPDAAATLLKAKADLICVAFGANADFALLQRLANTPQHAIRAATGTDLRRFFQAVGRTMSTAARTGQNAASLLGAGGVVRG